MIRAIVLALLPLAAQAQTFGLPSGCTAFLTVQAASCTVVHHYQCADDPAGHRRSVHLFSDGYDFFTLSDAEGQWIETIDSFNGTHERLADVVADPGRLSDLMDDGLDTFDFDTVDVDGTVTRFVGTDKMTGVARVIDGVDLFEVATEMRAEAADGTVLWSMIGIGVGSTEWRLGLGGLTHWDMPDDDFSTDDTPVAFALPGEPGFLSSTPQFGCAG